MNNRKPYTFEAGKEYRTRRGQRARLYADDGYGDYPLHGAVLTADGWGHETWTRDGQYKSGWESTSLDLLPPEPEKVVRYANIYRDTRAFLHGSRAAADRGAEAWDCREGKRTACVRIEYHEGQYDE